MIELAIVGAGVMGTNHARVAASMPEIVNSSGIRTVVMIWLTRSHQATTPGSECSSR